MIGMVLLFAPVAAQAAIVPIAVFGDPAPDGNGQLNGFGRPGINNAGQVTFVADNIQRANEESDRVGVYLDSITGGPLVQIAQQVQPVPGGNGAFLSFSFAPSFKEPSALNNSGAFAFHTRLTGTSGASLDDRAIYFGSGGPLSQVVRGGQPLPEGNGNFYRFTSFTMNSAGKILFAATVEPTTGGTAKDTGLYIGSSTGPAQKVVREGDPAPDGNGTFSTFIASVPSDAGKVAFYTVLAGIAPNTTDTALCLGSGTAPPGFLVREGAIVPGGNGRYMAIGPPAMNNSGEIVFGAELNFTAVPLIDDQAIYRIPGAGGPPEQIIRENETSPNGNGVFRSFGNYALNNTGRIAMHAMITGSGNTLDDGSGIFLASGGTARRQVARRNVAAPGGGTFSSMDTSMLALSNGGQVAFYGNFNGGGSGLFIGDGLELIQIVRVGQSLAGGTVTAATLLANTPVSDDHRSAINDYGQVAFFATTSGGAQQGVFVFTPTLNFQGSLSNNFEYAGNWTLGISPGAVHEVIFNPTNNVMLLGPTNNQALKSLQVGGGTGMATLQLQPGVTLSVTSNLTIAATGVLAGIGSVAGNLINGGLISPGNSAGQISVSSNLTQLAAGRMVFEIGGNTGSDFDQLNVGQTLNLAGVLDVVLINNFTPQSGQTFDLLNWGALNGTFSTVNLPSLPAGLSWDSTSLHTSGTVRITGGAATALQTWRQQHFGTQQNTGTAADDADPDGDGTVNFAEFAMRTDPLITARPSIGLAIVGTNLEFTYTRNKAALGEAGYLVEWSDSLVAGSWSTAGVTDVLQSENGTTQQFKATLPVGGQSRFVRLSVTSIGQ